MKTLIASSHTRILGSLAIGLLTAGATGCENPSVDDASANANADADAESDNHLAETSESDVQAWSQSAWQALGDSASWVEENGMATLELKGQASLQSGRFTPTATPNVARFQFRANQTNPQNAPIAASLAIQCYRDDQHGEINLGQAKVSTQKHEVSELAFKIPQSVQEMLVTDCDAIAINLDVKATGSFALHSLKLRHGTPAIDVVEERLCGLEALDEKIARGNLLESGHYDFESWLVNPAAQAELTRFHEIVDDFKEVTLGTTFDHHLARMMVIVDPDAAPEMREDLIQALADGDVNLPIRVQPGCTSLARVKEAGAKLETGAWRQNARGSRYSTSFDVARGKWVVVFDPQSDDGSSEVRGDRLLPSAEVLDVANALLANYEDAIDVHYDEVARESRSADASPHRGGAAIRPEHEKSNTCTAGFILGSGGKRSAVTAGHCFRNILADLLNVDAKSGNLHYGYINGAPEYPKYDMVRIFPETIAGEYFSPVIHTGPSAPITRTQKGKSDLKIGQAYCISGAVTGAICGLTVKELDATLCEDPFGCTRNLSAGSRADNKKVSTFGDSGGPVYSRVGATGAKIHGMHLGSKYGSRTSIFHKVSTIEQQLGLKVAL
jgi:hypothetical protein